jgi:hypothetical protein
MFLNKFSHMDVCNENLKNIETEWFSKFFAI